MSERVLNFSEFFTKYSGDKEKSLGDITQASSNFEMGFDETTYDQKPIGPNRPEAGSMEATPPSPGGAGAPAFSFSQDEEMNAPEEDEDDTYATEEQPEEEEDEEYEEEDDTDEEEEDDDVPEPEKSGANPKKKEEKEANESSRFVKGFARFINETYEYEGYEEETCPDCGHSYEECECGSMGEESCPDCGTPFDEFGANCGCNM
jgi:hypothetical protein